MPNGPGWRLIFPLPKPVAVLESILYARFLTPSSTSLGAAAPGACFLTISHLGVASTTTSDSFAWTEHGQECTPLCASACGRALGEIPNPAPESWTANR